MRRAITMAWLLAAATAGMLLLTRPAAGQFPDAVTDDIIVGNADAIRFENVVANSGLNSVLAGAAERVTVEFANAVMHPPFGAPPAPLSALLAQVETHIPVEFANAVRRANLVGPPTAMANILAQAGPRIVFEFANANRSMAMAYPKALINDTTAPVIAQPTQNGSKILWTTNEFTTIVVHYGTSPDRLNLQIVKGGFFKLHEITLPSLSLGATYYYQIVATDLSGNMTTSPIYEYRSEMHLYLPTVKR